MRLRDGLDQSSTGVLRQIAASHGLAIDEATTRAELLDRIPERLLDPAYLTEQLAALPDQQRAALLAAGAAGGEIRGFVLDRASPGAAATLLERGLLFRTFTAAGPRRGEVFAVPDEILEALPAPLATEPPPLGGPPPLPTERRASDPVFSLFALASTLARPGARLQAEVATWAEEPGGWDWQLRWSFLRHLGQAAGVFVQRADGGLGVAPALVRLLSDPPALRDRVWRAYLQDRRWSELAHAGIPRGQELAEPSLVREALLRVLARLPEGAWIRLDAVSDWLRRTQPEFLREQLDADGRLLLRQADWEAVERPLLRLVLLGPLYWLGRLAASADGEQVALRDPGLGRDGLAATGTGATLAANRAEPGTDQDAEHVAVEHAEPVVSRRSEPATDVGTERGAEDVPERGAEDVPVRGGQAPTAPHPESLSLGRAEPVAAARRAARSATVEPCTWDLERRLLAPIRADLGRLLQAERYLTLEQRGRPSLYRLDRERMALALHSGGSIQECRQLLEGLTRQRLPDLIDQHLRAWREAFGALVLRPTVVLEARSAVELDAALEGPDVRAHVRSRLGPNVAEVAAADALDLAAALRSAGHLPRLDAALRLNAKPAQAAAALVDEPVLAYLLLSLLTFERARPEQLAELEGAASLRERLEQLFAGPRLGELQAQAERLAAGLSQPPSRPAQRRARRPRPPRTL